MKKIRQSTFALASLCAAFVLLIGPHQARAQATAYPPKKMTHQGFLTDLNGTPVGSTDPVNSQITFRIYNAITGGTLKWSEEQVVTIDKGHFNVLLGEGSQVLNEPRGILADVFTGSDASERYMDITVGTTNIVPRLQFLPAPYAILAHTATSSRNLTTEFKKSTDIGLIHNDNTAQSGMVTLRPLTTNTADFGYQLGFTVDEFGFPSLNYRSFTDTTYGDWNRVVQKNPENYVSVLNATVAGGLGNRSEKPNSTIAGGYFNKASGDQATVGGGDSNIAGGTASTVGGGYKNNATGANGTVGGGISNVAEGLSGTVGGGNNNHASGMDATVGGGVDNTASGNGSTVPGGYGNSANGDFSFAAGHRAKAKHKGAFVWADSYGADFESTSTDQFLVRAGGGVGIGVSPGAPLHVGGSWAQEVKGFDGVIYPYFIDPWTQGTRPPLVAQIGIRADAYVFAFGFVSSSDRRIKDVVGLSDSQKDLRMIQRLRVTDYRHVAKFHASPGVKKGFLAQEVKNSIPEAVSAVREFIPNIYTQAKRFSHAVMLKTLSITMEKAHGLVVGDRVRLVLGDATTDYNVSAVRDGNVFEVGSVSRAPQRVFVYGKEVPDFLTVDYDRIFTTGIGAIQELAKQVEALQKSEARVAELERKVARMAGVDHEISELKKLVASLATGRNGVQQTVVTAPETQSVANR